MLHQSNPQSRSLSRLFSWPLTVLALVALAACTSGPRFQPADAQLSPTAKGNFDHVLLHPEHPLPQISSIYVETPTVTMSRHWLREYRTRYTQRDLDRIESDYSRMLSEALADALTHRRPVNLVETPDDADLVLRPTMRNVNIYAPDLSLEGITRKYAREAGNATLDLLLVDPATGQVLGQFVDHREAPAAAGFRIDRANRATNNRMFRRLMERWSHNLAAYLEDAGSLPSR